MARKQMYKEIYEAHKEFYDQKVVEELERTKKAKEKAEFARDGYKLKFEKEKQKNKTLSENKNKKIKNLEEQLKEQKQLTKQYKREKDESDKRRFTVSRELKEAKEELHEVQEESEHRLNIALHANSTNSDRPSSMDVLSHALSKEQKKKRHDYSTRGKSGLKRGGQPGHEAHRAKLQKPDKIHVKHNVKKAPSGAVSKLDKDGNLCYAVQTINLKTELEYVETDFYVDEENGKPLSKEVMDKFKISCYVYSDQFKAETLYLNDYGALPLKRMCTILKELTKDERLHLQPSTVEDWHCEFRTNFESEREKIKVTLLSLDLLQVDETGIRLNGQPAWMHVLCHGGQVLFYFTEKRGDWENGPLADLKDYLKELVCDHFASYQKLDCIRCECCVHLLRHVQSGIDNYKCKECEQFKELMLDLYSKRLILISEREKGFELEEIEKARKELIALAKKAIADFEEKAQNSRIKLATPEHISTLRRFVKDPDDYLRWAYDFEIPFSNNLSEQYIHILKIKKKASGQFVSLLIARAFVDEMTAIVNAQNKGESPLEALLKVLES